MDLAIRMLAAMRCKPVPWPAVARGARGAQGLSRSAFAMRLGIDPGQLDAVEAGLCAPVQVRLPLRRSAPYGALRAGRERALAPATHGPEDRPP